MNKKDQVYRLRFDDKQRIVSLRKAVQNKSLNAPSVFRDRLVEDLEKARWEDESKGVLLVCTKIPRDHFDPFLFMYLEENFDNTGSNPKRSSNISDTKLGWDNIKNLPAFV